MKSQLATGLTALGLVLGPAAMKMADAVGHGGASRAAADARRSPAPPGTGSLHPSCVVPFSGIMESHPIDDSCGAGGQATSSAQIAQNTAKNNFCASGPGTVVAFKDFDSLQAAAVRAGATFGSPNAVPADRSLLAKLVSVGGQSVGEGAVVRLGAFVLDAHYSNVQKGESVNCNVGGNEFNDIHIVLVEDPKIDDPCLSVTAEMSPHFRPEIWTPDTLNSVQKRKLRFTGQLFFDASHRPCDNASGTRENPARRALFEVHPVYAVDVCNAAGGTACDPASDTGWVPLDKWTGQESTAGESE